LRLPEQGADIIALDICADIPTIGYPMGTEDDLNETAAGVEKRSRRVVSAKVDVRDAERLDQVVSKAVSELGGLDIVSVNAGICDLTTERDNEGAYQQRVRQAR
jgi:NAD(P)-dependent dehydrogenase (short-subunit alcohol dehydrogenase family)